MGQDIVLEKYIFYISILVHESGALETFHLTT